MNFDLLDDVWVVCLCSSLFLVFHPSSTFKEYTGTVTHRSAKSIEERTRSVHDPSTLLNQVTVLFNFNLGSDLSLITQASLMLYQIPASNSDYVRDEEQYVEVSSITPARSGHLATMIIAGSFVNVFDQGPLVFDITTAVEQWIAMGTRGKLDLIISTYCFGSPLCAQPDGYRIPKSFKFAKASPSSENAPRIIVLSSTNPLESRTKRQAEEVGATSCIEGQTLCCLMPFIINFVQDLGEAFSMIRDPPLYQANFCEGICPTTAGGQLMVPAVFSYISQLENNPASSLTPCCAGYTYDSLPVLLDLGGTLEARVFENVVVASCTCS